MVTETQKTAIMTYTIQLHEQITTNSREAYYGFCAVDRFESAEFSEARKAAKAYATEHGLHFDIMGNEKKYPKGWVTVGTK